MIGGLVLVYYGGKEKNEMTQDELNQKYKMEREYRAFIFNALRDAGVTTKSGAIEIAFHSSLDAPHRWSIELFTRARMISETIDDYLITVDMKEADNG